MNKRLRTVFLLLAVAACLISPLRLLGADDDAQYSFKVHNTTDTKITKLLASEDGEKWGSFDIGSGIAAGDSVKLNWDKKTNDSGCKWWFKAVFGDGSESKAKQFDFCEEDLELEF